MKCIYCGTTIDDYSYFCEYCGGQQQSLPMNRYPTQNMYPQQNIQQSQQQNMQQNMRQNPQQNMQQNVQQNMQLNMQQNLQQNMQQNLQQNMQQNLQQNMQLNRQGYMYQNQMRAYPNQASGTVKKSSAGFIAFVVIMLILIILEILLFLAPGFLSEKRREEKIKDMLSSSSAIYDTEFMTEEEVPV